MKIEHMEDKRILSFHFRNIFVHKTPYNFMNYNGILLIVSFERIIDKLPFNTL